MISLKNNAQSLLSQSVTASDTEIIVSAGDGRKFPDIAIAGIDYFRCAFSDTSGNTEYFKVTARTEDVLTVIRGQEGSAARAWSAGARVQVRMTAATWREMAYERWKRLLAADGSILVPVRLSDTELQVAGDVTEEARARRDMRIPTQDGIYFIESFVYSGGNTVLTIREGVLPTVLPAIELSPESTVSHTESADYAEHATIADSASLAGRAELAEFAERANSAATADKWATQRKFTLQTADGSAVGEGTFVDGGADIVLKLPEIKVNTFAPGMFMFFLCRKAALPAGWHYPSGEYVPQSSDLGKALMALPTQIKSDWGVTTSGSNVSVFNNAKFFNGNLGRFPRMASGASTAYQPGVVEADAIRNITGRAWGFLESHSIGGSGAFYTTGGSNCGSSSTDWNNGNLHFDASKDVATSTENRPYSVHMTPAIYLGV